MCFEIYCRVCEDKVLNTDCSCGNQKFIYTVLECPKCRISETPDKEINEIASILYSIFCQDLPQLLLPDSTLPENLLSLMKRLQKCIHKVSCLLQTENELDENISIDGIQSKVIEMVQKKSFENIPEWYCPESGLFETLVTLFERCNNILERVNQTIEKVSEESIAEKIVDLICEELYKMPSEKSDLF